MIDTVGSRNADGTAGSLGQRSLLGPLEVDHQGKAFPGFRFREFVNFTDTLTRI